jgi:hypothetical protein
MTNNFVVSYTYALPLQRLTTRGVMGKVLEGWQWSGITHFSTGLPVSLYEWDDHALYGDGLDIPNYKTTAIQFMNPRDTATQQYFTTQPFSSESLEVVGDANRRFFHGPGLNNWDCMLRKNTRITERFSTELRIEFFNHANHAQFNTPDGAITDKAFGAVTSAHAPRIGQAALKLYF